MKLSHTLLLPGAALLLAALPGTAQINHGLDFTTTFPFYVGTALMPAGSYSIRQSSFNDPNILQVQSQNGDHSAFVEVMPTHAGATHKASDVVFNRYDNIDFLRRAWVDGQHSGYKVTESKAEQDSAAKTKAQEHSVAATAE